MEVSMAEDKNIVVVQNRDIQNMIYNIRENKQENP